LRASPGAADDGFGAFPPLGGAGGPPRRPAAHVPVLRNGLVHYLPVETIVAIHADAHYTKVFDGATSYFCSLSIGEIEHRLDPRRFARVHRSHIVDLGRIVGAKFNGDSGVVELAARALLRPCQPRTHRPDQGAHLQPSRRRGVA
jgi:LytTr DNA-binding domain-containing protein